MLDFFKVSNGIANNIRFESDNLGTGLYSGHVGASRLPEGHGVFINSLEIEYDGEWQRGKLCGFGRKYAKGYYDITQGEDDDASKSLVYAGEFKDNRFNGKGKQYRQTGKIAYDGDWLDGWKCGEGTEYYENGRVKYIGTWNRDRYHGKGVYTAENGDVIEGEWTDGLLNGEAVLKTRDDCVYNRVYKDGEVVSEKLISGTPKPSHDAGRVIVFDNGTYKGDVDFNGKMSGKGVYTYTNGNVYDGQWEDDMRNGKGEYRYKNGNRYVGDWKDNVKNGVGEFFYSSGEKYEGSFENSLRHGHGVFYYRNGAVFEGEWQNDMLSGEGILTAKDGSRKRQKWENNKLVSEEAL